MGNVYSATAKKFKNQVKATDGKISTYFSRNFTYFKFYNGFRTMHMRRKHWTKNKRKKNNCFHNNNSVSVKLYKNLGLILNKDERLSYRT